MKIKNIKTGRWFDLPTEEAKKIIEDQPDFFTLDDSVSDEEKQEFKETKVQRPVTIDDKISGNIDLENMNYISLCNLAKEYGLKPMGKKKEVIIDEIRKAAK